MAIYGNRNSDKYRIFNFRAATHLLALKKAVLEEGKQLLDAQQWAATVDYTVMAWLIVRATPVWDNPPHNNIRRQCFKALAANCMQALKKSALRIDVAEHIKNKYVLKDMPFFSVPRTEFFSMFFHEKLSEQL